MNNKGQSILSAMVAILLIGMAMTAFMQLMNAANVQQAMIQRKVSWISTKANTVTVLQNKAACSATVNQATTLSSTESPLSILNAGGSSFLAVDNNLGYQLVISKVAIVLVSSPSAPVEPTYVMGKGSCSGFVQQGNSKNYYTKIPESIGVCPLVKQEGTSNNWVIDTSYVQPAPVIEDSVQQAKILVSATYPKTGQIYTAEYYVNVNISAGKVTGCVL